MSISELLLYVSLFSSLFFEVVLLITYFEIRERISFENSQLTLPAKDIPSVSIIVPCYNEEKTVGKTVRSLLALDYPADKLSLIVVNDGSTDNTLDALTEFENHPHVYIFSKENEGSKFAALNFALEKVTTDLVGCLDADSFVDPLALKKMIHYFDDPTTMAVTPSIKVHEPKTVLQHIQRIEYNWGVFFRHLLGSMNALYVTPGPFSIYRTQVFTDLGGYRFAHHTEDMEMALRMHKNAYKIVNSIGAYVYTVTPPQLSSLLKQRIRWTSGFLGNVIDYRDMLFNRQYGNIGMFVLPFGVFSMFTNLYSIGNLVWHGVAKLGEQYVKIQAVGFGIGRPSFNFDWFYWNTGTTSLLATLTILISLYLLGLSLQVSEGKTRLSKGLVYYLSLYMFIAPLWLSKSIFNTLARKKVTWR